MGAQQKIKLIKKGSTRQVRLAPEANRVSAKPHNTEALVAGWVKEFQTRKRTAPKAGAESSRGSLVDMDSPGSSD